MTSAATRNPDQTRQILLEAAFEEIWEPQASPDTRRLVYRKDSPRGTLWLVEGW